MQVTLKIQRLPRHTEAAAGSVPTNAKRPLKRTYSAASLKSVGYAGYEYVSCLTVG